MDAELYPKQTHPVTGKPITRFDIEWACVRSGDYYRFTHNQHRVWHVLLMHRNQGEGGIEWASYRTLSRETGISMTRIADAIESLEKLGWVTTVEKGNRTESAIRYLGIPSGAVKFLSPTKKVLYTAKKGVVHGVPDKNLGVVHGVQHNNNKEKNRLENKSIGPKSSSFEDIGWKKVKLDSDLLYRAGCAFPGVLEHAFKKAIYFGSEEWLEEGCAWAEENRGLTAGMYAKYLLGNEPAPWGKRPTFRRKFLGGSSRWDFDYDTGFCSIRDDPSGAVYLPGEAIKLGAAISKEDLESLEKSLGEYKRKVAADNAARNGQEADDSD